jgi:hypothetical protein
MIGQLNALLRAVQYGVLTRDLKLYCPTQLHDAPQDQVNINKQQ